LADASELTQSARDVRLDQRQVASAKGQHGDRGRASVALRLRREAGCHAGAEMAPMTDARRIARVLMDVAFACPAAILVAFVDDPGWLSSGRAKRICARWCAKAAFWPAGPSRSASRSPQSC